MKILIDHEGYPLDTDLAAFRALQPGDGQPLDAWVLEVLYAAARAIQETRYGGASVTRLGTVNLQTGEFRMRTRFMLATGGWSGCEAIIGSLPPLAHNQAWESSRRGGLHIYEIPD
jgi:hypothetical protein